MQQFFAVFDFFATGGGLFAIGGTAALIVLLWEWRSALVGLLVVQLGIATLGVQLHDVPVQWAGLQLVVTLLVALMLARSVQQVTYARAFHQAGNWTVRLLALIFLVLARQVIDFNVPLPHFGASMVALFGWLALCALLMLGLGDSPFFAAVGLLLWTMAAQILLAVLVPSANLFALIGGVGVLVAFACSYLILLDRVPLRERRPVATDIVFPEQLYGTPVLPVEEDAMVDSAPLPGLVEGLFAVLAEDHAVLENGHHTEGAQPANGASGGAGRPSTSERIR